MQLVWEMWTSNCWTILLRKFLAFYLFSLFIFFFCNLVEVQSNIIDCFNYFCYFFCNTMENELYLIQINEYHIVLHYVLSKSILLSFCTSGFSKWLLLALVNYNRVHSVRMIWVQNNFESWAHDGSMHALTVRPNREKAPPKST